MRQLLLGGALCCDWSEPVLQENVLWSYERRERCFYTKKEQKLVECSVECAGRGAVLSPTS